MWIGVLWAGLRAAMWITHVGGKFRHGLRCLRLLNRRSRFAAIRIAICQKNPHVRNFSARNSGAGNGRANFMGAWDSFGSFCRKAPMPIK